ncbi:MAG: helix-turn-helix domain-containing protein [Ruminococcus sp.]|nr:helix-turn-helix domain-containing protein [Ruminococcus sp.]
MANIDNLFKIMAEKRISQKELAVAINASTGNVSDWKKGRSFPSAQKLDEAAIFLECSVDFLLGRTDNPNGHNSINNFDTTVSGTQVSGNHATINNKTISPEDKELLELIKNLTLIERSKVILFIDEMKNKEL